MGDGKTGNSTEFKSRWVVPTEESRAELAEWGLRTRKQQDDFYRAMAASLERLHHAGEELERRIARGREAAKRALEAEGVCL